jgi:hypothetical protein
MNDKTKYDAACKRILSEKSILAWIMRECLTEYKGCTIDEVIQCIEGEPEISTEMVSPDALAIKGMNTEDISESEGVIYYDIKFTAVVPHTHEKIRLIINIEAQNNFYPGYPLIKRAIYYCCRLISSQKGTEFTGDDYGKIKKVYSIWICMNPPKYKTNTITKYQITKENMVGELAEAKENYDLLSVIMICFGEAEGQAKPDILSLLSTVFSSTLTVKEKQTTLQDTFEIDLTQGLRKEMNAMCNFSDVIEARGEVRGEVRGIMRGEARANLKSIQNIMQSLNCSALDAMKIIKIPDDEQQKYLDLLHQ